VDAANAQVVEQAAQAFALVLGERCTGEQHIRELQVVGPFDPACDENLLKPIEFRETRSSGFGAYHGDANRLEVRCNESVSRGC
jgi:hypothetical protein